MAIERWLINLESTPVDGFGGTVLAKNANHLLAFFTSQYPDDVPPKPLSDCPLDLAGFFHVPDEITRNLSNKISGTYQSYAAATSVERPASGKVQWIRRSLVEITSHENLTIYKERQHRPRISRTRPEKTLEWEGYITPIKDNFVGAARVTHYSGDSTSLFIHLYNLSIGKNGFYDTIEGMSLGRDPEHSWAVSPVFFLERVDDLKSIFVDFCRPPDVDHSILSIICGSRGYE